MLLIAICLGAVACSTVVRLPSSTGQTPRTGGRLGGGQVGLDVASSVDVTVVKDMTTTPPDRSEILVGRSDLFSSLFLFTGMTGSGFDIGIGLTDSIDIYYTRNPGLRWMFLGDNKGQGWKSTVFAGPISALSKSSSNNDRSEVKINGVEYGISVGNQTSDSSLIYLTLASRGANADVTVIQASGTTYSYDDKYDHYIATLGAILGKTWYFKFEASANSVNWKGKPTPSATQTISGAGDYGGFLVGFGYHW